MARDGVLLQMFQDQRRKSVETLAHVGMARKVHVHVCRNDDYDACRRTAASPPPDWCPPVQKHAVHHPVRWLSSRPAVAPDRARQRTAAVHSSCRRRTPPLPIGAPFERSDRTRPASTEAEAIRCALEGLADRLDRVDVEASSLGIWLYREPQPAGVPIIVVEARYMRISLSTMRNKTDRNDARGIA
jgi:hypothetical protein